jgi:elongation factor P
MVREAAQLRIGNVIKIGEDLWVVLKETYNQGGRGASTMKLKMKNIATGSITENVVKADVKYEFIVLDKKKMQYLFGSTDTYTFMDQESYEQIEIDREMLGDSVNFLVEEMILDVQMYNGTPISIELPIAVELKIKYTEPAVKGDTSGRVLKDATLETEHIMQVPLYCSTGEVIRIDTRTGTFMERVK